MARTPLLSRFQQLFRDFDEAERTGRSVADVRSSRLSRRDFLKAGAATAGAFAMSGPLGRLAAAASPPRIAIVRSEEHTSELQSRVDLVCRLLLEKKKRNIRS